MKKASLTLLTVLALTVFLAAGCGNGTAKNKPADQGQNNQASGQAAQNGQAKNQEQSIKGTLMELMQRNKALKCSFSHQFEQGEMEGVVYAKGDQVRQDARVKQNNQEIETYMIMKGDDVYTWNSAQSGQGMKMNTRQVREQAQEQNAGQNQPAATSNIDTEMEYDCSAWNGDESKFELPRDVDFIDITQMMDEIQGMMGGSQNAPAEPGPNQINDMKQSGCAACRMAPDPEECRANLGCE
jgi:hypothetical protein